MKSLSQKKLTTYVALLRGINVGGNTIVSMVGLKMCFEKLDFSDVKTYSNSGNVIFRTAQEDPRVLETTIEKALNDIFEHPIIVVVRSFVQMRKLMTTIPKSWHTDTDQKCNVIFLRHTIDNPYILASLAPKTSIEELHYHPGVLFWSAKTSDLTKSAMLKLATKPIYKEMTVRIFNTTRKIYRIMQETNANIYDF